ncbi:MAG TPA: aminoacyl-tRNA hydrolase [Candidatus Limnocylindrales bacterium]|nr:aminoacyl-tRNA hydrolase [Candidatus Limnocylindrales bacterium]
MPVALSTGLFACPEGVMKIVVGLGNPGKQYEETRHNVGWMVLDRLAERAGWTGHARSRDAAATVNGRFNGLDLMLVKPTTYMNLSGVAVRKVLARQRAPLGDLLVVVDDFDLPLGRIRMRAEGSAGTHNGLRSIIGELGSQKFARLRVGIGQPNRGAKDHVLSRFATEEREVLAKVLEAAADAVEDWARFGPERAANQWNGWTADVEVPIAVEAADDASDPAEPTIVRRSTGWRRLLPHSMREDA